MIRSFAGNAVSAGVPRVCSKRFTPPPEAGVYDYVAQIPFSWTGLSISCFLGCRTSKGILSWIGSQIATGMSETVPQTKANSLRGSGQGPGDRRAGRSGHEQDTEQRMRCPWWRPTAQVAFRPAGVLA